MSTLSAYACFGLLLLLPSPADAASSPPAKIVLISIDTLRRDRVGCYEPSSAALTVHLDSFARDGVIFGDAQVQATWTLPSHASMLTSTYPSSHGAGGTAGGQEDWRPMDAEAASLAVLLKTNGYRTEGIVSSPVLDGVWGFARGFDVYGREERSLEKAAARLRRAGKERLFLFVHTNIVHRYARQKIPISDGDAFRCPMTESDFLPDYALAPIPASANESACRDMRRAYDRAVTCMDRSLAALLAEIKRAGGEDVLTIVTSDHGEILCDKHASAPLRGHGFPGYAELVEVPLIVRLPGGRHAGAKISAPVREIDIAPTILDAAGIPIPSSFAGRSLLSLLRGEPGATTPLLAEGDDWASARTPTRSYMRMDDAREELYDLSADPKETENAAPREPRAAAVLRAALKSLPARGARRAPLPASKDLSEALRAAGYRP